MNRASVIALVSAGILFGCAAGMVAHEAIEARATAQVPWAGQKWEYMCFKYGNNPWHLNTAEGIAKLNAKGAEGWELVEFPGEGEMIYASACFKRPLP